MTKIIEGELFNEIEESGNNKYEHMGFRNGENNFGDMIASLDPEIGMKREVIFTMEISYEEENQNDKN